MIQVTKLAPFHTDERGVMTRLFDVDKDITSVLLISSEVGAIRANHYHKNDTHWVYLLSGEFKYFEKALDENAQIESRMIHPGEMVVSRPNMIHAMEFVAPSVMIVFTTEKRDQDTYEQDTVRVKLV